MNAVSRPVGKPAAPPSSRAEARPADALAALIQSEEFTAIALACPTEGARLAVAPNDDDVPGPAKR